MPDASFNITGYIACYVCTLFIRLFLGEGVSRLITNYVEQKVKTCCHLIWDLSLSACTSVVIFFIVFCRKR